MFCKIVFFAIFLCFISNGYAIDITKYTHKVAKLLNVSDKEVIFTDGDKKYGRWYRISVSGKLYYLRIFMDKCEKRWRVEEIKLAQYLSQAKIGPKFVCANKHNKWYITKDSGYAIRPYRLNNNLLKEIGLKLHLLHNLQYQKVAYGFDNLFKICLKYAISIPQEFNTLINEWLEKNKDELKDDLAFCHNALQPTNIRFYKNRVIFICWHAAGTSNKYYDIGRVISSYSLTREQIKTLMTAYYGREPTQEELEKVIKISNKCFLLSVSDLLQRSVCVRDKYWICAVQTMQKYKQLCCSKKINTNGNIIVKIKTILNKIIKKAQEKYCNFIQNKDL